jgi:ribonucleoside-diphosphate reductase alpha chain
VAQVLQDFLSSDEATEVNVNGYTQAQNTPLLIGDLCPDCGEAALVNEEGCRKCYACGYSEC